MRTKFLLISTLLMILVKSLGLDTKGGQRTELLTYAHTKLGTPYKNGSQGFDCSGFVQHCYAQLEVRIPRSSRDQYKEGKKVDRDNSLEGDIIVFTGRNYKNKKAGHVGIVHHIENDTIYFIHSSSSAGIVINHNHQPYYAKRYLGIVRYL